MIHNVPQIVFTEKSATAWRENLPCQLNGRYGEKHFALGMEAASFCGFDDRKNPQKIQQTARAAGNVKIKTNNCNFFGLCNVQRLYILKVRSQNT